MTMPDKIETKKSWSLTCDIALATGSFNAKYKDMAYKSVLIDVDCSANCKGDKLYTALVVRRY